VPSSYLCSELAGFRCDVAALRRFYETEVSRAPSQPYFDNGASYTGWAITSRDGTIHDGVQQLAKQPGRRRPGEAPAQAAVLPTPLCAGPLKAALEALAAAGLKPFRARIMALADDAFTMAWHADAKHESWRLHVPIVTNPGCFFEWKVDERLLRRHLPADGRAWLVRVDRLHRAVNERQGAGVRVHLLMGLLEKPSAGQLGADRLALPGAVAA